MLDRSEQETDPAAFGAASSISPALPTNLAGGVKAALNWTYATGACGTVILSVSAAGVETETGRVVGPVTFGSEGYSVAGTPVILSLVPTSFAATAGTRGPVEARLMDNCGIGVPWMGLRFSVSVGGGQVEPANASTDARGSAVANLVLGLEPGRNVLWVLLLTPPLSASTVVQGTPNPLALASPGGALSANAFSPSRGEVVLARIRPRTDEPVLVQVFTASGRLVRALRPQHFQALGGGQWLVTWDGKTEDELPVARGVYLIRVSGGGLNDVLKVVVR
jgi:hypothetical protein